PPPVGPAGGIRFGFPGLARLWPVGLGVVIGVPCLLLVVWLLWPSERRIPPGGAQPRLADVGPVTLRGGQAADLRLVIQGADRWGPLEVRLGGLPPGVRHGPLPEVPPGQAEAVVRLEA